MHKQTIRKLCAALAVLTLTACERAQETQGVSDDEIVIGAHTALSGPASFWGVTSTETARLLFEEVNARGGIHGRKIRFIVEDTQYQVPLAVKAVNKLINRDRVFAMHVSLGTAQNNAVFNKMFAANVPSLFPLSGAISMAQPLHKLKFQALATYNQQVRDGIRYFHKVKGHKRICALYQDSDFGQEVKDATMQEVNALGLEFIAERRHKPTETEFVGALTALKNANCDLIVFGTIIQDAILAYTTARKIGVEADIMGILTSLGRIVSRAGNGAMEGFYISTAARGIYRENATPAQLDFINRYNARYGKDPNAALIYGHLPTKILIKALEDAGRDLTVEKLVAALENIKDFDDGIGTPRHSYSPTNHAGTAGVHLDQVRNGDFVPIAENIDQL